MTNRRIAETLIVQPLFKKYNIFYCDSTSSFQNIKIIIIVNKKNLNEIVVFCEFFDKYCMYREFTSYILSLLYVIILIYFFVEK